MCAHYDDWVRDIRFDAPAAGGPLASAAVVYLRRSTVPTPPCSMSPKAVRVGRWCVQDARARILRTSAEGESQEDNG